MADITGLYQNCLLCPRACGVDRLSGKRGFCGETAELRVAAAVLHRGEEPPLTGKGGSGTIFITGCNLGCAFCQNYQISQGPRPPHTDRGGPLGRLVSAEEFAGICLKLQNHGAENINIVTGSHAIPAIARGLSAARSGGLTIPALWNSSAYECPNALELLQDQIDLYLPDLKTLDSALAVRFFNAPDYPQTAAAAILKMMETHVTRHSIPTAPACGVIIRHLVLPGHLDSTRTVLRWFAEHARGRALFSLMTQYTPIKAGPNPDNEKPQNGAPVRFLSEAEYETVLGWLEEFGIEDGFCQELAAGNDWLPDFNHRNPFSTELSVPMWHWRE
jgi:putative pyruvate formate lyase activating enzyme